jgi:hypothetical protein
MHHHRIAAVDMIFQRLAERKAEERKAQVGMMESVGAKDGSGRVEQGPFERVLTRISDEEEL